MLGKYVGPRTEHLPLIAPGLVHNTGLGLAMGLEVGKLRNLVHLVPDWG